MTLLMGCGAFGFITEVAGGDSRSVTYGGVNDAERERTEAFRLAEIHCRRYGGVAELAETRNTVAYFVTENTQLMNMS